MSKKEQPKKNPWRPRKYDSPEEFNGMVDAYVEHCKETGEPMTWTGMALYLGFAGRVGIDEYLKYDGFSYAVKRAKSIIEAGYERRLHGNNPTGSIFVLKNMGWSDRQDMNLSNPDGSMTQQPTTVVIKAKEPELDDE